MRYNTVAGKIYLSYGCYSVCFLVDYGGSAAFIWWHDALRMEKPMDELGWIWPLSFIAHSLFLVSFTGVLTAVDLI